MLKIVIPLKKALKYVRLLNNTLKFITCFIKYFIFLSVFQKGQVETNKYRFLSKGGGYVWVITQATILNDHKGQKPESIMCINYVVR